MYKHGISNLACPKGKLKTSILCKWLLNKHFNTWKCQAEKKNQLHIVMDIITMQIHATN